MGRGRSRQKDLPLGVYPVDGRYYVRPVNVEMRQIFKALQESGRIKSLRSLPLGSDKAEARKLWVKLFVTDRPAESAASGTVAELIQRYSREILPLLPKRQKDEETRQCTSLTAEFGAMPYAKSEAEASTGPFLRSLHLTRYLRRHEAVRPVAANREVQRLSRIFRLAKTLWGYTEYNPCLQIEYNRESAREQYHDDDAYMKVYDKAAPVLKCMMDLAQMNGSRRGMLLRLTLADVDESGPGVWFTLNKRRRGSAPRRKLVPWTDDLRDVIQNALQLRKKVRGGQRTVADLSTAALFLNRKGKPWTETGFNSAWQRAARDAGFGKHEFHFHDLKAKAITESATLEEGMKRGDHVEPRTTRRVYTRKPDSVVPLPRASSKKAADR